MLSEAWKGIEVQNCYDDLVELFAIDLSEGAVILELRGFSFSHVEFIIDMNGHLMVITLAFHALPLELVGFYKSCSGGN